MSSKSISSPPHDSLVKSWLAVLSISLGSFILVTSEFLPIGLLTQISPTLHISDGMAGLMVTIPAIVAAFAGPTMAVVAGHLDRRTLVLGFLALLVVSNLGSAFAPNLAVMLAARVLFGVSLAGFWTIAVTLGNRLVPKAHMARATTFILAGVSLATVLGVPAGTVIAAYAGWRAAFVVSGMAALLVGITQLFVLPSIPPPPSTGISQLTACLRHVDVRLGLLTVALVVAGHFAAYTYVRPFLEATPGVSAGMVSTVLLLYGVAGVIGNFVGGAAAGRNLRYTITSVVGLMGVSFFLLPFVHAHLYGVIFLIATWGLSFGAMPICLNLWVFKAAPEALEGGAALLIATFQVFIALGSVFGGHIVDNFGTSAVMWAAGFATLAGLVSISLSKHSQTPASTSVVPKPDLACSCAGD
jgi:predicted MFS family arabinose efflux permease